MPGPFFTPVAEGIPFDNTINGFSADKAQSAIEEAKATAVGLPRWTLTLTYHGIIQNNTWIGYQELIPGNDTPIIIGIKSYLSEFIFSNATVDASFNIELYKNGLTPGDLFKTISKTNIQYFVEGNINELFEIGDIIYIKYIDTGSNATDACILLMMTAAL